jgi:hypothetical protein
VSSPGPSLASRRVGALTLTAQFLVGIRSGMMRPTAPTERALCLALAR